MSNVVALKPKVTIGGSEAAAAAGIDPYLSRVGLWMLKTGKMPEPEENEAMAWGKRFEDDIDDALRERGYGVIAQPPGWPADHRDAERLWLVGHPDALAYLPGVDHTPTLLERKTVGQWVKRGWNGDAPNHYAAQVQHYLHLTGLDRGLLAVLVGGQKLETYTIHRSQSAIDSLLFLEEEFYGYCCQPDVWPDEWERQPAAVAEDNKLLNALPGTPDKVMRLGRKTSYPWLAERREAVHHRDAWSKRVDEIDARFKLAMRDATVALDPWDNEVIRWTPGTRHALNVKRLREEQPDIAAEFEEETETRRFTVL